MPLPFAPVAAQAPHAPIRGGTDSMQRALPLLILATAASCPAAAADDPPPDLPVVRLAPEPVEHLLDRISAAEGESPAARSDFEAIVAQGSAAIGPLAQAYRDPAASETRRWVAARALGRIGGYDALTELRDGLRRDSVLDRMAAASALQDLRSVEALGELLSVLARDPALAVRIAAVDALARLGPAVPCDPLLESLDADSSFHGGRSTPLRAHLVAAIAATGDPRAVRRLIGALKDADAAVRVRALEGLVRLVPEGVSDATMQRDPVAAAAAWLAFWEARERR